MKGIIDNFDAKCEMLHFLRKTLFLYQNLKAYLTF